MALLTADDVLNKKFQPTKFREGYDQDEVDDFLDEVVNTLRAVYTENEELKAQLAAGTGGEAPAEPGDSAPEPDQPGTPAEPAAPAEQTMVEQYGAVSEAPAAPVEPEVPEVPEVPVEAAGFAGAEAANEPESATGMLHLAQRLHDEYVNDGKAEADRLLADAREESERLTSEADELRTRTLNQLEEERTMLERKIDELRGFERDYRARLKSYLDGLLQEINGPTPSTADPLGRGPSMGGGTI